MGWSQPQRGRVGRGTQGCGLALPGTVLCRLGPPAPSQPVGVPTGRLRHTDPEADCQTQDPSDFVHRHGIGGALGRGPRKWLPGCGGEGSQLLPSDPGGCEREPWTESGGLAGGHAQRSSRVGGTEATTGEELLSSAKITPSGPKWEVSRAGRLGEPHPQEGRHLKDSQEPRVSGTVENGAWRCHSLSPFPPL